MTPDLLLSALFVFGTVVACVVVWRFSNATFTLSWTSKTSHPEPGSEETARLVGDLAEARRAAQMMRLSLRRAGLEAEAVDLRAMDDTD